MAKATEAANRTLGAALRNPEPNSLRIEHALVRLSILLPVTDSVMTPFFMSMNKMLIRLCTTPTIPGGISGVAIEGFASSLLPWSRQRLVDIAREKDATHCVFIDTDMSFPPDSIERLLRPGAPIVGINASTRRPPFRCTAQAAEGVPLRTDDDSTGLEKVLRMGFGMMLIDMRVFDAIEKPHFLCPWVPEKQAYRGEDYYFCEKARAAGFELLVDHDLSKEVRHVGMFDYDPIATTRLSEMGETT